MLQTQKAGAGPAGRVAQLFAGVLGRGQGRSRIQGFVDHVVADAVQGWAFDPARPDRRVLVVATAGGEVISEALADLPRRDLAEAGKGDGRHGFRLRIPADLSPDKRASIRIEAVAKPRNSVLQKGSITVPPPEPKSKPVEPVGAPEASVGFLEQLRSGVLKGWAIDPNHPSAPARVDIFDGEVYLGTVTCDRQRPKLRDGAREFEFRIPSEFDPGNGAHLRGRIAGTRLELKRSRHYPGQTDAEDSGPEPTPSPQSLALETDTVFDAAAAPEAPRRARRALPPGRKTADVLFLACGASDSPEALSSCALQTWSKVQAHRADLDGSELEELIGAAEIVALLHADQRVHPDLAGSLALASKSVDVWTWRVDDDDARSSDADVAVILGESPRGGIAVRSSVLAQFGPELSATLKAGDLGRVARWAADRDLRWSHLPAVLASGGSAATPADDLRPEPPRRVSLAVWSGWGGGLPPALPGLLAACKQFEVEVLIPAAADDDVESRLSAMAADWPRVLQTRRIDTALEAGVASLRQLGEGATGQVVVFCHGELVLSEQGQAVTDACAWATHRRLGAVTLQIGEGADVIAGMTVAKDGGSLRLVSGFVQAQEGRPRPVLAASPIFMAISRAALAKAGGLDDRRLTIPAAALDLSLKLRSAGKVAAVLGQHRIQVEAGVMQRVAGARLSPLEMALVGDAAEREAVCFPAPQHTLSPAIGLDRPLGA